MDSLARLLVISGIILIAVGGLVYLAARLNLPLGQLPGDIRIQSGSLTCLIPLATSILLSVVLTVLLNLILRVIKK